jgi:hypothetical protein
MFCQNFSGRFFGFAINLKPFTAAGTPIFDLTSTYSPALDPDTSAFGAGEFFSYLRYYTT